MAGNIVRLKNAKFISSLSIVVYRNKIKGRYAIAGFIIPILCTVP